MDKIKTTKQQLPKTAISMPVLEKLYTPQEMEELRARYTRYYGRVTRGGRSSKWVTLPVLDQEVAIFKEWRDGNISLTEARRQICEHYPELKDAGKRSYCATQRLLATATSLTQ